MYDPEFTQLCIKTLNSYYSCNSVVLLGSLPNTPMTDYYQILFVEPPHENNWRYYHFKKVLDDNDIPYDEPCNVKPIKSKNYNNKDVWEQNNSDVIVIHNKYKTKLERILFLFKIQGKCCIIRETDEF